MDAAAGAGAAGAGAAGAGAAGAGAAGAGAAGAGAAADFCNKYSNPWTPFMALEVVEPLEI